MSGDVEEHVLVLRSRVLGPVRSGEAHHQQDRLFGERLLRLSQKLHRVVEDLVREVILRI